MELDGLSVDVLTLLDEFVRSDAQYLHYRTGGFELTISRLADTPGLVATKGHGHSFEPSADEVPEASALSDDSLVQQEPHAPESAAPRHGGVEADHPALHVVHAPVVGVFYSAPGPGEEPYVRVGAEVGPESTVGLVEAMKVFTAVFAGSSGIVESILVENGAFVEYDHPLMHIRAAN